MHSHRLEQARSPWPRGPHGDGRHRDTLVVVTDEAPCLLVRDPRGHRVPSVDREGRPCESSALDRYPFVNVGRHDGLDAQRAALYRVGEVDGAESTAHPAATRERPAAIGTLGRSGPRRRHFLQVAPPWRNPPRHAQALEQTSSSWSPVRRGEESTTRSRRVASPDQAGVSADLNEPARCCQAGAAG